MEFLKQIIEWPVIIQGALGSFLFWLTYELGSRFIIYLSSKLNENKQIATWFSLKSFVSEDRDESTSLTITCLYGAMHYLLKALLFFSFAWVASLFNTTFELVGYAIGIYFLFRSLSYVPHYDNFGTSENAKLLLAKLNANLGVKDNKK